MKRIFLLLSLLGIVFFAKAQKVYTDSIDFSLIVANDTVVYPSLGHFNPAGLLSVELDFTGLNNDSAYVQLGGSNTGTSFNNATSLYGVVVAGSTVSYDSIRLDTLEQRITNGVASGKTEIATAQSTILVVGDQHYWKYFGMRFIKNDVTAGKVYYYILKP